MGVLSNSLTPDQPSQPMRGHAEHMRCVCAAYALHREERVLSACGEDRNHTPHPRCSYYLALGKLDKDWRYTTNFDDGDCRATHQL